MEKNLCYMDKINERHKILKSLAIKLFQRMKKDIRRKRAGREKGQI